jgi:hypothetical protein
VEGLACYFISLSNTYIAWNISPVPLHMKQVIAPEFTYFLVTEGVDIGNGSTRSRLAGERPLPSKLFQCCGFLSVKSLCTPGTGMEFRCTCHRMSDMCRREVTLDRRMVAKNWITILVFLYSKFNIWLGHIYLHGWLITYLTTLFQSHWLCSVECDGE